MSGVEGDDLSRLDRPIVLVTRPRSVTVFASLHIAFGVFGLVGSLCFGAMLFNEHDTAIENRMRQQLNERFPIQAIDPAEIFIRFSLSALLLTAGLGLSRMRPWARTASIVYAVVALMLSVYTVLVAWLVLIPFFTDFVNAEAVQNPAINAVKEKLIAVGWGTLRGGVFSAFYPAAVLLAMNSRTFVEVFRAGEPGRMPGGDDAVEAEGG